MTTSALRLHVRYSQFTLDGGPWDLDDIPFEGGNGLLWATDTAVVVTTGVDSGHVPVTFILSDQPPAPDLTGWDEAVEVSIVVDDGLLVVCSPAGEHQDEVTLAESAHGSSPYRVRVQARGRDAGRQAQFINADKGDQMVEEYLILLWPAPLAAETRLKLTDQVGTQIRAEG
jgi:hypothetical protein